MAQPPVDVGAVHGGVAAGTPAGATADQRGMRNISDENFAGSGVDLRVAFEAKVHVALNEHFVGNGAVRVVADDAALAERFVFVDEGAGLLAMTFGAGLIHAGEAGLGTHTESRVMGGFEDVRAVWVVALNAIHSMLENRMMVGQLELRVDVEMACEAGFGLTAGIDDEFAATAAGIYVETARAVAGFATGGFGARAAFDVQASVRTGMEGAGEFAVTILARFAANEGCAFDFRGTDGCALQAGTRNQDEAEEARAGYRDRREEPVQQFSSIFVHHARVMTKLLIVRRRPTQYVRDAREGVGSRAGERGCQELSGAGWGEESGRAVRRSSWRSFSVATGLMR